MCIDDFSSHYFKSIGVTIISGLAEQYISQLSNEFEEVVPVDSSSKTNSRTFIPMAFAKMPTFNKVLLEYEVQHKIEKLIGRSVSPVCGDATRYYGSSTWHFDVLHWQLPVVKVAIYLDKAIDSEVFSFLPCSHRFPNELRTNEDLSHLISTLDRSSNPITEINFHAGDGIIFNPRVAHAVFSKRIRRQVSIMYAALPENNNEIIELQQLILMNSTVI